MTDADSWTSASYDDEDVFWDRDRTLRRLVEETQSAALVGLCLDSDFLGVVGLSPDGATCDGVVYRDAAEESGGRAWRRSTTRSSRPSRHRTRPRCGAS